MTGVDSRGLDSRQKALSCQTFGTKVARHQPVSQERVIGFDSRRLHQFHSFVLNKSGSAGNSVPRAGSVQTRKEFWIAIADHPGLEPAFPCLSAVDKKPE